MFWPDYGGLVKIIFTAHGAGSFRLVFWFQGRNETRRGAAAHDQAQAVKGMNFVGYEPQYIKSEP